jgi:hypothetical protein
MSDWAASETSGLQPEAVRQFRVRYALLTAAIFLPLLWAFVGVKNVYPVASWTVMMMGGNLQRGHSYFLLRGETVSGEVVDIPAIELTDALSGRNWGLAGATVANAPFQLRSPHPANVALLAAAGDIKNLQPATRLPELLRAWGTIYNSRWPTSSSHRLKAIRLDAYRWMGQSYSNYDHFIESWRQEL